MRGACRCDLLVSLLRMLAPGSCSLHSIRVCQLILEHRAVSPAELAEARVAQAAATLLDLAHEPSLVEAFLPEVLELLACLIDCDRHAIADGLQGEANGPNMPQMHGRACLVQ